MDICEKNVLNIRTNNTTAARNKATLLVFSSKESLTANPMKPIKISYSRLIYKY